MELLTLAEKQGLEARLKALIDNRPVIATRIAEARAMGDLKENGDYHAAREQQGMDEAEIRRLEERLRNVSILDEKMSKAFAGTVDWLWNGSGNRNTAIAKQLGSATAGDGTGNRAAAYSACTIAIVGVSRQNGSCP